MKLHPRLHAIVTILISSMWLVHAGDLRANSIVRKALIIGNDNYSGGRLKNAVNDATAIAMVFSDLNYQVTVSTNATRATLENAVDVFVQNLSQGDFALVYYSGHGLQADGENYLIPTDFVLGADDAYTLRQHAYSLGEIIQKIQRRGVATSVVILDACRDNPFLSSRSTKRGWSAPVNPTNGTYLAFATAPGSTASDNPNDVHGLFTKALLQYIAQPLTLDDLFARVRRQVIEASHGLQVPWTSSSLITSVHLNPQLDPTGSVLSNASDVMSEGNSTNDLMITRTKSLNSGEGIDSVASNSLRDASDGASARLLISNALALAKHKNVREAVRILDTVVGAAPLSSLPLRILGLLFHLLGQRSTALSELDKALTIDPADFRALYYRCLVLAPEDPAAAIGSCESSLGIKPNFSTAHLGLSNAWLAAGDVDKAYGEASRSVALLPLSPLALSLRGRCELQMGKYEDAQRDFEKARILQQRSDNQSVIVP